MSSRSPNGRRSNANWQRESSETRKERRPEIRRNDQRQAAAHSPSRHSNNNNRSFSREVPAATDKLNSIGTVTQIDKDCGVVNDEVFFDLNVCRDECRPRLGMRVLFEAHAGTSRLRRQCIWIATRIQIMTQNSSSPARSRSRAGDDNTGTESMRSRRSEHRDDQRSSRRRSREETRRRSVERRYSSERPVHERASPPMEDQSMDVRHASTYLRSTRSRSPAGDNNNGSESMRLRRSEHREDQHSRRSRENTRRRSVERRRSSEGPVHERASPPVEDQELVFQRQRREQLHDIDRHSLEQRGSNEHQWNTRKIDSLMSFQNQQQNWQMHDNNWTLLHHSRQSEDHIRITMVEQANDNFSFDRNAENRSKSEDEVFANFQYREQLRNHNREPEHDDNRWIGHNMHERSLNPLKVRNDLLPRLEENEPSTNYSRSHERYQRRNSIDRERELREEIFQRKQAELARWKGSRSREHSPGGSLHHSQELQAQFRRQPSNHRWPYDNDHDQRISLGDNPEEGRSNSRWNIEEECDLQLQNHDEHTIMMESTHNERTTFNRRPNNRINSEELFQNRQRHQQSQNQTMQNIMEEAQSIERPQHEYRQNLQRSDQTPHPNQNLCRQQLSDFQQRSVTENMNMSKNPQKEGLIHQRPQSRLNYQQQVFDSQSQHRDRHSMVIEQQQPNNQADKEHHDRKWREQSQNQTRHNMIMEAPHPSEYLQHEYHQSNQLYCQKEVHKTLQLALDNPIQSKKQSRKERLKNTSKEQRAINYANFLENVRLNREAKALNLKNNSEINANPFQSTNRPSAECEYLANKNYNTGRRTSQPSTIQPEFNESQMGKEKIAAMKAKYKWYASTPTSRTASRTTLLPTPSTSRPLPVQVPNSRGIANTATEQPKPPPPPIISSQSLQISHSHKIATPAGSNLLSQFSTIYQPAPKITNSLDYLRLSLGVAPVSTTQTALELLTNKDFVANYMRNNQPNKRPTQSYNNNTKPVSKASQNTFNCLLFDEAHPKGCIAREHLKTFPAIFQKALVKHQKTWIVQNFKLNEFQICEITLPKKHFGERLAKFIRTRFREPWPGARLCLLFGAKLTFVSVFIPFPGDKLDRRILAMYNKGLRSYLWTISKPHNSSDGVNFYVGVDDVSLKVIANAKGEVRYHDKVVVFKLGNLPVGVEGDECEEGNFDDNSELHESEDDNDAIMIEDDE